jgi:hypothetical protein
MSVAPSSNGNLAPTSNRQPRKKASNTRSFWREFITKVVTPTAIVSAVAGIAHSSYHGLDDGRTKHLKFAYHLISETYRPLYSFTKLAEDRWSILGKPILDHIKSGNPTADELNLYISFLEKDANPLNDKIANVILTNKYGFDCPDIAAAAETFLKHSEYVKFRVAHYDQKTPYVPYVSYPTQFSELLFRKLTALEEIAAELRPEFWGLIANHDMSRGCSKT